VNTGNNNVVIKEHAVAESVHKFNRSGTGNKNVVVNSRPSESSGNTGKPIISEFVNEANRSCRPNEQNKFVCNVGLNSQSSNKTSSVTDDGRDFNNSCSEMNINVSLSEQCSKPKASVIKECEINEESVNNDKLMLPAAVEGGLCSESVNRVNKPVEVVCKAVESVSESVQCSAVTTSQAKAELNYRGLKPLLVANIKIVDSEILKTEQKNDPTLFKHWELAKKGVFEEWF